MSYQEKEKSIYLQIIDCNNKLRRALDDNHYTASDMKRIHHVINKLEDDFIYMNETEELMFIMAKERMNRFLGRKELTEVNKK
ncbi:MAG: hypothetical protein ACRCW9_06010 [Cetobacterium sp.]